MAAPLAGGVFWNSSAAAQIDAVESFGIGSIEIPASVRGAERTAQGMGRGGISWLRTELVWKMLVPLLSLLQICVTPSQGLGLAVTQFWSVK